MRQISFCFAFVVGFSLLGCGGCGSKSETPDVASASSGGANQGDDGAVEESDPDASDMDTSEPDTSDMDTSESDASYMDASDPDGTSTEDDAMSMDESSDESEMSEDERYAAEMLAMEESSDGSEGMSDEEAMATAEQLAYEAEMNAMAEGSDPESMGQLDEPYNGTEDGLGGGGVASEPEPEPLPTDYLSQAKMAFAAGSEQLAYKLLLAHLIAEPELAQQSQTYSMAGWSPASRRPRWGVLVGLGINNVGVRHDGDLHPIESDMSDPVEGGQGGGGRNGGSAYGRGRSDSSMIDEGMMDDGSESMLGAAMGGGLGDGDAMAEIRRYSGLVGSITVEQFNMAFSKGDFGKVFSSVSPSVIQSPDASKRPGRNNDSLMMDSSSEMMDESSEMMEDGSMGEPGAPGRSDGGHHGGQALGGLPMGNPRVAPGLEYLGSGHPKELLAKAKESGLDFFLQIDVSVTRSPATGTVNNDSGVRWVQVSTGRPVGRSTGKINNRTAYQAMTSRSIDPSSAVSKEVAALYGTNLDKIKLLPMPELTASQVVSRVGSLLTSSTAEPMEILAETRLYRALDLLSDEQVHFVFDLILGDDGLVLSAGPEDERVEILEPFAAKLTGTY